MSDKQTSFQSYTDFWPYYLSQHSKRGTRLLHIIGSLLALFALAKAVITLRIGWLIAAPILGYGFAWFAHSSVEKNRPATFIYPLWSLRGDFDMLRLWLTGRLEAELIKYRIMA